LLFLRTFTDGYRGKLGGFRKGMRWLFQKGEECFRGCFMVRRMFEEGEELKRLHGAENVFDFSLGNPNLEPPSSLKKALKTLADEPIIGMHRYMPNSGYSETRKAIAEFLAEESNLPFNENLVVMTVGQPVA
jgi:aspartate aminotransferase